jgi:hypothetical protein
VCENFGKAVLSGFIAIMAVLPDKTVTNFKKMEKVLKKKLKKSFYCLVETFLKNKKPL